MPPRRAVLPLSLTVVLLAPPAVADEQDRTTRIAPLPGGALDGPIAGPALGGLATMAAFSSTASRLTADDANGPVADVFTEDLLSGRLQRASVAADGGPANGPSRAPALSENGLRVAFVSDASNLVDGDTNGVADIFVHDRAGATTRVSLAADGAEANGPSSEPDISADGRRVVFTSLASNLVPGDTNGVADVFVRDLARSTTRRVSVSGAGVQGSAASGSPAISANGKTVVFRSSAPNLVRRDTNRVDDIFARDDRGAVERVSVGTDGAQQDKAIKAPFVSVPDVSGTGRYVVFDSDATTLSAQDLNRRTDVYLRDRVRDRTELVSASALNVQGNNDSVTPRITPNGRFVTFQSFATNLTPDDGPREDLFVRDRLDGLTALVNATDSGARRRLEPGGQLLQRAPIADDGRTALFLTGARGVTAGGSPAHRALYLRRLKAPTVKLAGPVVRGPRTVRLRVASSEPAARRYLCRIDAARAYYCSSAIRIPARAGRVLSVRAGGPGMLWSKPLKVPITRRS